MRAASNRANTVLVVDYISRYPEVLQLRSTTSSAIIRALTSIFTRHGIPEVLRSDNGPQYSSQEFAKFASSFEFNHITSSPRFPQSNGQAERTVQTVKRMLTNSEDLYIVLLSYRATPLPRCNLSPAELCMGRRLRTSLPIATKQLIPQWPYIKSFRELNKQYKGKQKASYDRSHRAKVVPSIPSNTQVWITSEKQLIPGNVISTAESPRSYVVETPTGEIQRNRNISTLFRTSKARLCQPLKIHVQKGVLKSS